VGDRDGRAADLDALDLLGRAVHPRIELRRTADLDALRDLDLVSEVDSPVARQMERERPGRRPRCRILGHAAGRSEHPVLPPAALTGEAVEADRGRLQSQTAQIRLQ